MCGLFQSPHSAILPGLHNQLEILFEILYYKSNTSSEGDIPEGKAVKSFQEIYDQVLAEMQAARQKGVTFQRSSITSQPPPIPKSAIKSFPGQKPKTLPSGFKKEKPPSSVRPRVLNEGQKEALACFQYHGERLDEQAGINEIKKAFRRLAKKFHPDKISGLNQETQNIKAEQFQQILLAYRLLLEMHPSHK